MSIFTFNGPDGKTYDIQGDLTRTEAETVFKEQLSSGGLTGIPVGGIVNAVTQASGGLASAVSQIGPQAANLIKQAGGAINLPTKIGAVIPNAISVSDFVNTKISAQSIGTIASNQVQGLVAQASASVNQAANTITNAKGLGQFGLDANQLQLSGLIKPGLADQINLNPSKFKEILSSPTSWTGKLGATNLDSVLNNTGLQTRVQQGLMNTNFDQLKQLGTIKGTELASQLGPLLNNATKFGATTATDWLNGKAPGDLVNQMTNFATSAKFSQSFADVNSAIAGGGNPLQSGIVAAKGVTNTVNRTNLNQATTSIIGNPKVVSPDFAPPSATPAPAATKPVVVQTVVPVITSAQLVGKNKQQLESLYKNNADVINISAQQLTSAERNRGFAISVGDTARVEELTRTIAQNQADIAQARANQQVILNALNQLSPNT